MRADVWDDEVVRPMMDIPHAAKILPEHHITSRVRGLRIRNLPLAHGHLPTWSEEDATNGHFASAGP